MLVAGFQGVSTSHDVTTLGRGGSDTTAVAVAAALGAEVCEIYTDVAGVFSADPRIVPDARKLPVVSFEEMLEMSASGAGVLQLRSVEYARNHGVRIHCRSSFDDGPGTVVVSEEETMEHPLVTAVTHSTAETRITLLGVPDEPGIAGRIFAHARRRQRERRHDHPERAARRRPPRRHVVHGARARTGASRARRSSAIVGELGIEHVAAEESMGKVSIVGAGMRSHPGVAATVFSVLGDAGINIEMISTSPIKISCVIAADRVPEAVRGAALGLRPLRRGHDPGRGPVRAAAMSAGAARGGRRRDRRGRADHARGARSARASRRARSCRSPPSARPGASCRASASSRRCARTTIAGFDIALFSAGGGTSREWAPRFAAAGAVVVDNSSAWRMDPQVPLVVSEVNPDALEQIERGIVANPNCTTMVIMLPLKALHDAFGLREIVATSFQAAGGAGQKGMDELAAQVPLAARRARAAGQRTARRRSPRSSTRSTPRRSPTTSSPGSARRPPTATATRSCKLVNESRKILELPDLRVSPTCVRVPVMVGHCDRAARDASSAAPTHAQALAALEAFPGVVLDELPTPVTYAGRDEVAVGRMRSDLGDAHSLNLFVVGDNLLKGAALNAVQIAELLVERGLLGRRSRRRVAGSRRDRATAALGGRRRAPADDALGPVDDRRSA